MPITLYMMPLSPPARAVLLTAEALGVKIQTEIVNLSKQDHLKPEFIKLNPQHTIPVLDDNGTVIWESHAIIAYLVRKYGKNDALYPKDFAVRAMVDQRLHFETGVVFGPLRRIVRGLLYKGHKAVSEDDRKEVLEAYQFLEKFLEGRKWVVGDAITIADFSLVATITSSNYLVKIEEKEFPNIIRWIKQAEQLSYYQVNATGLVDFANLIKSLLP